MNAEFAMRAQMAQNRAGAVTSGAFTLIETLAAVALLGLIGSVVVVGLAGAGERARTSEVVAILRDLDQRARELAVNEGPVALEFNAEERRVKVVGAGAAALAERWLPASVELTLQDGRHRDVNVIRFDRLGRCEDYTARISTGKDEFTLFVSGLTGWMEETP